MFPWAFIECGNEFHSNIYCTIPDEFDEEGEADPMDEPEATDRSGMFSNLQLHAYMCTCIKCTGQLCIVPFIVRIRNRLKKLMAKRPQLDQLKNKGIIEGKVVIIII